MDYYKAIKDTLVSNETYKRVKDYSKNRSDLESYYKVGKLLSEAGKHYGEGVIKEYSNKLTNELGKGYSQRNLYNMRLFYIIISNDSKLQPLAAILTWTNISIILNLKDKNKIIYYLNICAKNVVTKRELLLKIKSNEYERLDESTRNKLITQEEIKIQDLVKNPIIINNNLNKKINSEQALQLLILDDLPNFMEELGEGFCFIKNEYKIKIGTRYNYIDMLLFNIKYNCYVVIELKVTELRKEYIGQIEVYMNYIDKNVKSLSQDKTIGIIICKKDNKFVMEYCSDNRIFNTTYVVV